MRTEAEIHTEIDKIGTEIAKSPYQYNTQLILSSKATALRWVLNEPIPKKPVRGRPKSAANAEDEEKRQIITVCGSTRFSAEIYQWALEHTLDMHNLVLFAPFAKEAIPMLEQFRKELEIQHFQKIRLADVIFVFNKGGYIGDSTKLEIAYAEKLNKIIEYLERVR